MVSTNQYPVITSRFIHPRRQAPWLSPIGCLSITLLMVTVTGRPAVSVEPVRHDDAASIHQNAEMNYQLSLPADFKPLPYGHMLKPDFDIIMQGPSDGHIGVITEHVGGLGFDQKDILPQSFHHMAPIADGRSSIMSPIRLVS